MKNKLLTVNRSALLLIVFLMLSCSSKIVSFVNPKAKFSTFETYILVNPKIDRSELADDSKLAFQLIKSAIQSEMNTREYRESSVSPDLTLRYEITSSTRVQTDATQDPFSPFVQVNTRTIHEGILLLELYDARKKLVWQGSYDLQQESKEKRLQKVIENAVGKIFTSYPYRALNKQPDPELAVYKKKSK